jgi:predicted metal-dependent phosphoesterase TrpH
MRRFMADLHVHTALSPCASREMTPPRIVHEALDRGLDLIAVCDHNSAGNAGPVQRAAGGELAVIPGMEITTKEEVHVLGLFPSIEAALGAGEQVLSGLPEKAPAAGAHPGAGGEQLLLDETGAVIGREPRLLAAATNLSLARAVDLIRAHGGLAVAAHLDRRAFSVLGQLGFIPENVRFDALEISAAGVARGRAQGFEGYGLPLLASSDGHFPEDIGAGRTVLEADEPSFAELALALRGEGGRRCGVA